jgi:hypothetical protein
MTDESEPAGTTRRTVLGAVAAGLGTAGVAGATRKELDVDADNLVASNRRFTITVDGVRGSEIQEVTVTVGGVAFAAIEVLERDPAVLVVEASNLIESEPIRRRGAVEVSVWLAAGGEELTGSDKSQVIPD